MDSEEQELWLVLSHLPGCTPAVRRRLQRRDSHPLPLLQAPDRTWREAGAGEALLAERRRWHRAPRHHPATESARRELDKLHALQVQLLALGRPGYPGLLAEIHDPPPLLYLRGNPDSLRQKGVAIVGSRRASAASRRDAREFGALLAATGLMVCSGLALGIDGEAHRGALDVGGGTVAVMATGIDITYPRRHAALAEAICERGALLTEMPPGFEPRRECFPQRNRLISGLTLGTVVVAAAPRSGSLVTARLALEQNREVMALPHATRDPGGQGCHALIRQGAALVQSPAEVLLELGLLKLAQRAGAPGNADVPPHLRGLFKYLDYAPLSPDELAAQSGQDIAEVTGALAELELLNLVEKQPGGYMQK